MRFIRPLTLAGLLALAAGLPAKAFEGRITYSVHDPKGGQRELQLALSGSKVRFEMAMKNHSGASIIDIKEGTVITLIPDRKAYMSSAYKAPKADQEGAKATVSKTGAKATIAGYEAQEWVVEKDGHKTSLWLTESLGRGFFQGTQGAGQMELPADLKDKDVLALRVSGAKGTLMEATKVEPGHLDAALFSVPEGYTKMDAGLGGAGGGEVAERMKKAMEHMTPAQKAAMQQYLEMQKGK